MIMLRRTIGDMQMFLRELWQRIRRALWHYRGYRRAVRGKHPSGYIMAMVDRDSVDHYMEGHAKGLLSLEAIE